MSSTDIADEGENIQFSRPKKRPKKRHLDSRTKETIINVYKYEMLEYPAMGISEIERRVADRPGLCYSTMFTVVKEYKQNRTFSESKRSLRYKQILDFVGEFNKSAIRRKVHQFFFRNELPTVDKVLREVNNDPDLPSFKRTAFWKL